jgi:large subunit ribosomal protein L5|uniref:Large ribosomal subunit protein uL5c n=1 Tax=Mesostigma viride TaxID=41882 RepID=RK5_MESVI|nr:ribosomal protein L5 [Mesostigma viride]Q9MUU5.1 RecName: Full=Large ribosomal subunit protein uL5c; AltName: Full=50S ribosomal protein L5, chloroplastic [Mesostigma viride]AAF43806.1 ribosomal protein L5 [Mesostigma viride]WKT08243.1 ribosomal protein L5 [Mesostigma viride]WKT08349.1 ribosomal protein L5 [Mesostigma viride]
MVQRLKTLYLESAVLKLQETFGYKNPHQIPRIKKIVINCGLSEASQNSKSLESAMKELSIIAGQKGVITRAKKAIAGFKIREGLPIGICITLRGDSMYAFLDRLINLALPRIRDFQGVSSKSFDGHGNYNLGLKEQLMFPEIDYDQIDKIRGMDICIVTNAKTDSEGFYLLEVLGMPFKEKFAN